MRLKDIRKLKNTRAVTAFVLVSTTLAISPVLLTGIMNVDIKPMGQTQVTWQDAMTGCNLVGETWSLPSIYQLAAIYYRRSDIKLVYDTDYWSHNAMAGFAFGLNTGRGIASFDRYADTDHFLCIRQSLK